MLRLNNKNSGWLASKFFFIISLMVVCFICLSVYNVWHSNTKVDQEISSLEDQIKQLEYDNADLGDMIEYLNSAAYAEEKARTDLGLKKAGEKSVIFTNLNFDSNSVLENTSNTGMDSNNFKRWVRYFFHKG